MLQVFSILRLGLIFFVLFDPQNIDKGIQLKLNIAEV